MRHALLPIGTAAVIGLSTLLLAQASQDASTDRRVTYKALERAEIEVLGGYEEAPKATLINNEALTTGLNSLAEDGWCLVAIEQRHTRPITGPKGTTYSNPATYIFERGE